MGTLFTAINTAMGESAIFPADDTDILDLEYLGNHSGGKIISPLVYRLLQAGENETLTNANVTTLAKVIANRYGRQWVKLNAVFSAEYNPVENYSMLENMTDDTKETVYGHTNTRTDNLSHTKTGTETLENGLTVETTTDVYGYDSGTATPSEKETAENSGDDVTRYNTTDADTGTQTDRESGTDTETRNYELTRAGNIGVTSSQQLLQSEIDLWQYDFMKIVYANIDEVLTISVY
jgi:hypothetical protein